MYHVAAGDQTGATGEVTTLLGTTFEVNGTELIDNDPEADNPNVVGTVAADNGQIQVIDNVLLPIDTPIGQVLTTMIHVCENDGDLSIDFGTHECIYTEDVFFAKATPKEVFKAGDAVNVQLQYLEIAEGSVVSPELIAVGAQDDVIGIDIRIANSDFDNLDVKKILTFDTSVLENFLLSNGGDSIVISQFDNVRVYDPATGRYSLEVAEARVYVDGFGPATRDTPGLVAELEALIAQEQAVTITYLDSNHVEQTAEICIDFSHEPELFTPIALDLNGDGEIGVTGVSTVQGHEFDQNAATVEFDLDADGTKETIEWFNGDGDGILVNTDLIGPNNEIDGAALYGDQGGLFANGYEKLSQLEDDNGDGVINGVELDNIALWVDDGDAVLEAGEIKTLASESIKAISTEATVEADGRLTSKAGVDLEATGEVSYSLEGPDAAFFQIDAATGELTYAAGFVPDFENPQDQGHDNIYDLVIVRSILDSAGDCIKEPEREAVQVKVCDEDDLGSLSGRYFCDENGNDVDDGEPGIAGVVVTLNETGETTVTDSNGFYSFDDLPAGEYSVTFTDPDNVLDGKDLVAPNQGGDDAVDSDAIGNTTSATIAGITVVAGQNTPDNDAGAAMPETDLGSISGRYFCDENGNALEDPGEAGAEGIRVRLRDQDTRKIIATTFTDANGDYSFEGLEAGRYQVRFDGLDDKPFVAANVGNDDAIDSDVVKTFNNGVGRTNSITLGQGENVIDVDAGVEGAAPEPGSLSGTYFCDENGNAVRDGGDTPVAGVLVMLLDAGGNATGDQVFTDANGTYSFAGLAAGTYGVKFTDPNNVLDGKELVAANQGGDDSVDSDAIGDTTESIISGISVVGGQDSPNNDAGAGAPATGLGSISGRYFCDENGNALEDPGEAGAEGIRVRLRDQDTRKIIATTFTDANGDYSFEGLEAGRYQVRFDGLDDKSFVAANVGNDDAIDSDVVKTFSSGVGRTNSITLGQGENVTDVDAGVEGGSSAPTPVDDMAMGCADEVILADVLTNDSDPDGDTFAITMVDGQTIAEGQTITTSAGTNVTLDGGVLKVDGAHAYAGLDIGQTAVEDISYKITDSAGNSASATLKVTFCGDANTLESLVASLPGSTKYQVVAGNELHPIEDFGYDVLLSDSGDARLDGVVFDQAYCLSFLEAVATDGTFLTAPTLMGDILDGKDSSAFGAHQVGIKNGLAAGENLDLINWIINEEFNINSAGSTDGQFSDWEIQLAIWELTDTLDPQFWGTDSAADFVLSLDPIYGQREDVDFILTEAMHNGEGFCAGDGDIATFIVDPNPPTSENSQPFILGFKYDDFDCIC